MNKFYFSLLIFLAVVFLISVKVSAVDRIKTSEHFVASSAAPVSGAFNSSFTFYIGDDLSGVSNPVKSLYFKASGVYTGGGSLSFSLDSDAATTKTFTLPTVSAPTPFEILYKDPSNKISPTSGGSYSYTLNVSPSGVTIYGLGAKLVETHRYKPPACGGFPATGELTSRVFDTGTEGAAYNSVMWEGTLPANTKVRFQLATSDCANGAADYPTCSAESWNFIGGESCSSSAYYEPLVDEAMEIGCFANHNNKRYFRYKAVLCSDALSGCVAGGSNTPQITDIVISWSP